MDKGLNAARPCLAMPSPGSRRGGELCEHKQRLGRLNRALRAALQPLKGCATALPLWGV